MIGPHDGHPSGPAGDGVVVLAGGRSRRWGGTDKTAALLAGRPVLRHVLDGVRAAFGPDVPVVVAGPAGHPCAGDPGTGARWVLEDPPGGGPVAGLAAGLAALPQARLVGVLAGDVPFGGPAVHRLVTVLADSGGDALVGADARGRRQPLLGAYRADALRAALAAAPVPGRAVRDVLAGLDVRTAPVDDRECLDLDTPDDLALAAALLAG